MECIYTKLKCRISTWELTDTVTETIGKSNFNLLSKNFFLLNHTLLVLCTLLILSSCSSTEKNKGFKTTTEAYDSYVGFLQELKKCDSLSIEDATAKVREWQILRDSVYSYISIDTINNSHTDVFVQTESVTEDIKTELFRLSDKHVHSFTELIKFNKDCLPDYRIAHMDAYKSNVGNFFNSLDTLRIPNIPPKQLARSYFTFLNHALQNGFTDRTSLLSFFRDEDLYFRCFLTCFNEFENLDMAEVSKLTEKCCYKILKLSDNKNVKLDELKCFMIMRTNRRLLQNAQVCFNHLKKGGKLSKDQASAYLWMTLQPFSTIGPLSLNLLTQKDEQSFLYLSDSMPYILSKLNEYLSIDYDHIVYLPKQILKATIYNL